MAEADVIALKEALYRQAQSMQEISDELIKERKAAASGVDEALSMILRLQEERAKERMEASQYKRITEAMMIHAEESLDFLKESVLEKEREIATLKYQLQSCKQIMLRVGLSDTSVEEIVTFNDSGRVSRHNIDKSRPLYPTVSSIWSEKGECSKQRKEQRKEQRIEFFSNKSIVEEVSFDSKEPKPSTTDNASQPSNSLNSQSNSEIIYDSNLGCIQIDSICRSSSCSIGEAIYSTNVHDIYEVPKCSRGSTGNEHSEFDYCKTTKAAKLKTSTGSLANDLSYVTPMILQNDFEQLKKRVKKIEKDQRIMIEEDFKRNNEQLHLLRVMHEQLNKIQSQTKVSKKKKASEYDAIILDLFTEALLSFAL